MKPKHHIIDDILMAHAAGLADPGIELIVSAHLVLCPACRGRLREIESIAGAVLDMVEPVQMDPALLDQILGKLDPPEPTELEPPPTAPDTDLLGDDLALPRPILDLVASTSGQWTAIVPGVLHELRLPLSHGEMPIRLIRMRAGFKVPTHTHTGTEMNMVLAGGYNDADQEFVRGDVQICGDEITHSLSIHGDGPCVLLAVNEAPLVPVGALSKVAQMITGEM
jgi:putative transcriptional regulator